jgi:hypothetical protein
LILVVQQARVHADTVTAERQKQDQAQSAERAQRVQEREDFEWQREVLETQRTELAGKLADGRRELSHLEDHVRRLEAEWRLMQAEAAELDSSQHAGAQDRSSSLAELARLRAEIDRERGTLEEARRQYAQRRRSFAIIPYPGPHGTRRRPIYIECSASGIVIQPEGTVLGPEDFLGPLGPGNPLDAALRAIREHWARVEGENAQGEPYPLLIVRPDGAVAYAMARAAMTSWDDEFGYELVDGDMKLAFPPSDPHLKQVLQDMIATARQRQAVLAAAMPSRFETGPVQSFSLHDRRQVQTMVGSAREGDAQGYGLGSRGSGSEGGSGGYARHAPTAPEIGSPLGLEQEEPHARQASHRPGQPAGAPAAGLAGDATGSPGGHPGGTPGGAALPSIASQKGENWALPDAAAGATGITRPILVECHPDRLVIKRDRGDTRPPQVVMFRGPTQAAVDEFVSAVWRQMEWWGMAMAGGYWKPILKVKVLPDAEVRFIELEALLKASGMEVEKR